MENFMREATTPGFYDDVTPCDVIQCRHHVVPCDAINNGSGSTSPCNDVVDASSLSYSTFPTTSYPGPSSPLPMLEMVTHGEIWTPDVVQRIATLVPLMAASLLGNVITVVVLTCSKYRKLNSRINIFIINLAIGDLAVCCFTMTTEVLFVVFDKAWMLGAALCKILLYVQMVTLASTTFILTAMSVDRYLAICRPLSLGSTSGLTSRPKAMICVAWLGALIFASPQLFIFKQVTVGIYPDGELKHKCMSRGYTAWWQRKTYFTFLTAYILVIPAFIICFCYINVVRVVWRQGKEVSHREGVALRKTVKNARFLIQAKVNTIKVTFSIICAFIGCWTPYFVVHLIHIWSEYNYYIPDAVYVFSETLALLNSALNPMLYGFFNVQLKRGLIEVCCPRRIRAMQSSAGQHSVGGAQRPSAVRGSMAPSLKRQPVSYNEDNIAATASACSDDLEQLHSVDSTSRTKLDHIITEQNQRGFKLRVQFVGSSDRSRYQRQRCLTTSMTVTATVSSGPQGRAVKIDDVRQPDNRKWVSMKRLSTSAGDLSGSSWSRGDSLSSSVL